MFFRLTAALTLMMLAGCAPETLQTSTGEWLRIENQPTCAIWNPLPQTDETVTWSGPCVDGKAEGTGDLVWRFTKEGKRHTQTYSGQMVGGKGNGRGISTGPGGSRGEGIFNNWKLTGRISETDEDGSYFESEIKDGKLNGKVIMEDKEGRRLEGTYINGKLNGHAVITEKGAFFIEGEFKDSILNGHGVFRWNKRLRLGHLFKNGQLYGKHDFVDDIPSKGAITGTWQHGKIIDGTFSTTKSDNTIVESEIKQGKETGTTTITYPNGDLYKGGYVHGERTGYGVIEYRSGLWTKYKGFWKFNSPGGHGVLNFRDGSRYDGNWKYGFPNGYGTFTNDKGIKYEGSFKHGCLKHGDLLVAVPGVTKNCGTPI